MSHYFCSECGGVSETPSACQTEECSKKDQQLQECDCGDTSSHKIKKEETPEMDQEMDSKDLEESDEEDKSGTEL